MNHLATIPVVPELVIIFVASVAVAYLCYRARLVPIAGFLLAGVFIGPSGFSLVTQPDLINVLAEIGVILLLFTIGVEFSLEKLSRIRRVILLGGSLQVGMSIAVVLAALLVFGATWREGVFTGCLVALSSTAIVLGILTQRDETTTTTGRLSLGILIFQDLAVVAMALLIPILGSGGKGVSEVLWALTKAGIVIAATILLARRVVPWILEKIAQTRSQELFLLTVVAICFGTATAIGLADVSLSLGAFLAGLIVSESRYSEHALSEILPLRTVFTAVFFVSVGMLLDIRVVLGQPLLLLAVAAAIVLIKIGSTAGSVLVLGYPARVAFVAGLALAQVGEFSFVLQRAGAEAGLSPAGLGPFGDQAFLAVSILLMLLTPFLFQAGSALERIHGSRVPAMQRAGAPAGEGDTPLEDHVIIVGCGTSGRRLVHVLRETQIAFVVVEMNPATVKQLRGEGITAIYGDASRPYILQLAGIETAKLCVVVISDASVIPRITLVANFLNPTLQTIVRTRFVSDVERLIQMGADIVVPEEMETTVRIFSHVLGAYLIPPEEIDRQTRLLRGEDYRIARGGIQEAHLMVLQGLDEDGLHTRAVAVRAGSPAAGKSLEELALRRQHGLTVLAVRRQGRTYGNPAGDFRLEPGDRLIMVGTADTFAACAGLFRSATLPEIQAEIQPTTPPPD